MPTTTLLGSASTLFRDVAPWAALLLIGVVIGVVGIIFARRLLRGGDGAAGPALTLHDLRQMRDRGDLSAEEFDRIRERMIERWRSENKPPDGGAEASDGP